MQVSNKNYCYHIHVNVVIHNNNNNNITMGVQSTVLILSGLLGLLSTTIGFASLLAYHLQEESEDSNEKITPKLKINIKSDKTS